MNKQKLFADFDSTIVSSLEAYVKCYNILYNQHPNFIKADSEKVQRYDLKDQCPLIESPLSIFKHPLFFQLLEFMPNAEEIIKQLTEKYQVIICTIGCWDNIYHKTQFIKNRMPYIKDAVLLTNNGIKMDKSIVSMGDDSIFLDDIISNLISSDSGRKILYGKKYDWNKEWAGEHCLNWLEVGNKLL